MKMLLFGGKIGGKNNKEDGNKKLCGRKRWKEMKLQNKISNV